MAKSFVIVLVATFIFSQEVLLSTAAPASDAAFQEWLLTFDPSKTPASRSSICVSKPDGVYPEKEPDTCSSNYYACVGGAQYPQTCQTPKVWNATTLTPAGSGSCTETPTSTACKKPVTVAPIPPPGCTSPGIQDGVYQPTAACSSLFYFCVQGQIYFQSCPTAAPSTIQYFDPATKKCADIPSCKADAVTPAPPTVPPFTCSGKTPDSLYALGTCTPNYYSCASETAQPLIKTCANAGEVFDYAKAPKEECIPSAMASGCKTTTTKKPYSCPASSGSFSIPGTTGATCCMNYYSCSGSVANKVNCPSGYYFESSKSACISKMSASSSCQQKPIITCTY